MGRHIFTNLFFHNEEDELTTFFIKPSFVAFFAKKCASLLTLPLRMIAEIC